MSLLPFSKFKQGNDEYEVVDAYARQHLSNAERKWVFFGDSYGINYTSGDVQIVGWFDKLKTIMNIDNADIVHSDVTNGKGFIGANNDSTSMWKTTLNTYTNDSSVTDVCFIGGDNDVARDMNELASAIEQTIIMARTKFPNARVWVGFCAIDFTTDHNHNMVGGYSAYSKYGAENGAIIMDSLAYCLYNKGYLLNASHPNNDGTKVLAAAISSSLNGGIYYNGIPTTLVNLDTTDSAVTAGSELAGELLFSVDDNQLILDLEGPSTHRERGAIKFTGVNLFTNYGTSLTIGLITNVPLYKQGAETLGIIPCGFKMDNVWHSGTVRFQIWNNYLQAQLYCVDSSGYKSGVVTEIEFGASRFVLNMLRGTKTPY